jgi:hypothetical protein
MSILDGAVASLQSAMASAGSMTQDWSQSWDSARAALIAKAGEFSRLYSSLASQRAAAARDPQLLAAYDDLMAKGAYIRSSVQSITQSFDSASDWFTNSLSSLKNMIGLNGVPLTPAVNPFRHLSGLGLLPLIPVGVIAAATAAISYWLSDAYVMSKKLNLAAQVQASGGDPNQILGSGTFSNAIDSVGRNVVLIGVIAGIAFFAWPAIKRGMK